MNATQLSDVAAAIFDATGTRLLAPQSQIVLGGSVNSTYVVSDGARQFFVKINEGARPEVSAAEVAGLALLAAGKMVRVPSLVCRKKGAKGSFLILEYLPLTRPTADSQAKLGRALAQLHRTPPPAPFTAQYGLDHNNFIGATPQNNAWSANWPEFFRERRLRFQLELAAKNGFGGAFRESGPRLLGSMHQLFADYTPQPGLLHGDLWSGNVGTLADGTPVLFDPAVYYGDRETDIAMTEVFGGFTPAFYDAYDEVWPRDPGYAVRRPLYNLYHMLNHLNLFGEAYLEKAIGMVDSLNAELH